jgi:homogentisate phytyltransferase/homogentisate geranylgeranyltransferase
MHRAPASPGTVPPPPSSWYALQTLWQFSRPHTIIGSTLSICALYVIALRIAGVPGWQPGLLIPSLLSALLCNVYITGLNQWADVEVDRINKPWLPIPSGRLTRAHALLIVLVCGVLTLALAALFSVGFVALMLIILGIGTAYSLPPLKFKRHHLLAAGAITVVRGLLVNLGFYLHFRYELTGAAQLDPGIWPLTLFVAFFSLGIAWFKDIPDTRGDAAFQFGTLAVKWGRTAALVAGVLVVSVGYGIVIAAAGRGELPAPGYFSLVHALLLVWFLVRARRLRVDDDGQVKRFYRFFWLLFFLEYIVYPLGFYWGAP